MKHPMFNTDATENTGGAGIDYLAETAGTQKVSTPGSGLNQGSVTQNQNDSTTQNQNTSGDSKEITLSDGRKAIVMKGKGKHAMEALKISNGDQSKYLPALIAQLVTIDGKPVVMEDLEWIDLKDYMALQVEFAEQNF